MLNLKTKDALAGNRPSCQPKPKLTGNIMHIFTANRYHLVPMMVRTFITKVPANHFFVLIGNKNTDWKIYKDILREHKCDNYLMYSSFMHFMKNDNTIKTSFIILHGIPRSWMLYFYIKRFTNVHWVCWGSGVKIGQTFKARVGGVIRKVYYKMFKSIITLSEQDKQSLQEHFGISRNSVARIPYISTLNSIYDFDRVSLYSQDQKEIYTVYLGNNATCMELYVNTLDILKKYRPLVSVQCMLHYSLVKGPSYELLQRKGEDLFSDQFSINTTLYSLKDYVAYMDLCDIYICSKESQSGLGAINVLLKLGKKLYLKGHNFDYASSLGAHVKHVDELLNTPYTLFVEPLTVEERIHNYDIIMDTTSEYKSIDKWTAFFKQYLRI